MSQPTVDTQATLREKGLEPSPHHPGKSAVTLAGMVGNILEWYDFAIYGYFAPILAKLFFPSADPVASVLAAFGVFAIGFFMRPIGGLIFGHIGDCVGRRTALTWSVILMAGPTFCLGLLPTYAEAGILSTILLVLMRLLQGIAVGGEYTSSVVFLVEEAPAKRRGFFGSWTVFGAVGGILLGSAVGALVTSVIDPAEISDWGWRVPFLCGLVVGGAGWILRKEVFKDEAPESPHGEKKEAGKLPVVEAFQTSWRSILHIIGLNLLNAVGFYTLFVYITTYLTTVDHMPMNQALEINTISMVFFLAMLVAGGALSDKVGRKPVLLWTSLGCILFSYPLFELLSHDNEQMVLAGQFGFAVLLGLYLGTIPTAMVEMAPVKSRCSVVSIGYNICLAFFGGTSPMVAEYLIHATDSSVSPAIYIMAIAAITLVSTLYLKETAGKPLASE